MENNCCKGASVYRMGVSPSALEAASKCALGASVRALFKQEASQYSVEGQIAHALAELIMAHYDNISDLGEKAYSYIIEELKYELEIIWSSKFHLLRKADFLTFINSDMVKHCINYINFCLATTGEWIADNSLDHGEVIFRKKYQELQINLSHVIPTPTERTGFVDYVEIVKFSNKTLIYICDLKYGMNPVYLSTEDELNLQIAAYALGVYDLLKRTIDGDVDIIAAIYQPRSIKNPSKQLRKLTLEELECYRAKIKEVVKNVDENYETPLVGSHCNYCPATIFCASYQDLLKKFILMLKEKDLIRDLTNDKLVALYSESKLVTKFIKLLQDEVSKRYEKGELNNYLTAKTRKKTTIIDEDGLVKEAFTLGIDITKNTLVTLTELRKLLPKHLIDKYTLQESVTSGFEEKNIKEIENYWE